MRINSRITIILLALAILVGGLQAHPTHQTTAEVEYNATTKQLEITLIVDLNDLELALTRQCDQAITLDKTPADEFDAQVQIYLGRNFEVTDAAGKVAQIQWVGRELVAESIKSADPAVRLFFQVSLTGEFTAAKLRHSVFCGLFKDQINLVQLRHDKTKRELRFLKDDAAKKLVETEAVRH